MGTERPPARRASRRLDSTPQRIVSLGLATATAVGLVGVLAVRTAQEGVAAEQDAAESGVQVPAEPTTSTGLTQADLDAYAAQLDAERQRLEDYRAQLVEVAAALGGRPATAQSTRASVTSPQAAPAPKPKAVPESKPAPSPQAQSQGS